MLSPVFHDWTDVGRTHVQALLLALEHRYYGKSNPGDVS